MKYLITIYADGRLLNEVEVELTDKQLDMLYAWLKNPPLPDPFIEEIEYRGKH